jgi:hypothetical protein
MTRYDIITGRKSKDGEKTYWTKVGVAFSRDQGGFSIELEAYPLPDAEGKVRVLMVEPKARDDAPDRQAPARGSAPMQSANLDDDTIPF